MITLYHVSNPCFRDSILKNGLIPKTGPSYKAHYEDKTMGDAIFVSLKNNYDSTYDDDRYEISLSQEEFEMLDFKKDKEVADALYTNNPIPRKSIKLFYKGSGKSTF
jgi:hypothetical protein